MTFLFSAFSSDFLRLLPPFPRFFGLCRGHRGKALISVALLLVASAPAVSQDETDLAARRSRVMAFESAWGRAEKTKDIKALDALLDNSLTYIDYDGTLKSKSDFLAGVKAAGHTPEEETAESMSAQIYGDTAVVIGVYRVKGIDRGKPYLRRGRFTDTWISHKGNWVCVASQFTLIPR
jgi:hypothetical protein